MRRRSLSFLPLVATSFLALSCGSSDSSGGDDDAATCETCPDTSPADVATDGVVTDGVVTDTIGSDTTPDTKPPACGTAAWPTYGHDGQRTFATDACITGPLTVAWSYSPAAPAGKSAKAVQHVIADKDAVYLQWAATIVPYLGTTALDRVSLTGSRVWTMDTGTDANEGNWASIVGSNVVVNDDGVYFVDAATGKRGVGTGVDWWGQSIPNATGNGLWLADTSKSDGPGLFVGLMDDKAKMTWKQNEQGTACGDGFADTIGGIALDSGVLFYAASYTAGSGGKTLAFASGLYAFDAAAGTPKWKQPLTPTSVISAGDGLVYLIEGGKNLVARKQSDGTPAWTMAVTSPGAQAPALAAGLVLIGTATGVAAFDAKTGASKWTSPVPGAAARAYTITITNGCSGSQNQGASIATSIAIASASSTVVVTGSDGVHVLDLTTGAEKWKGAVTGAKTPVHDPVLVGSTVYVVDSSPSSIAGFGAGSVFALKSP